MAPGGGVRGFGDGGPAQYADHELDAGVGEGLDDVDVAVVDAHVLDGLLLD